MNFKNTFSFLFFGSHCIACKSSDKKSDPWLCKNCREELIACGEKPILVNNKDVICLFPMNNITRSLVLAMKYKGMQKIASYLIEASSVGQKGEALQILESWSKNTLFIPVPIHNARKRERGYNQSEKIAFELALHCGGKLQTNILERKIYKPSQTLLGSTERSLNVAGAFEAKKIKDSDVALKKSVVLVDDVYTTGATTAYCTRALKKIGFTDIKVCTLLYEFPVSAAKDFDADKKIGLRTEI